MEYDYCIKTVESIAIASRTAMTSTITTPSPTGTTPIYEPRSDNFILAMLIIGISFACIVPTMYHCIRVKCNEYCRPAPPVLPTTVRRSGNGRAGPRARIVPAPPPLAQLTSASRSLPRVSATGATLADATITVTKSACIIITLPETVFLEPITCPICLSATASGRELVCKHQFHSECIETWLNTSNTCPTCRAVV